MNQRWKAVRTDCELECPEIDAGLRAVGCELVLLPERVSEDELAAAVRDTDLLLMCYTPVTARIIAAAEKLKGTSSTASASTRSTFRPRWRAAFRW